ncbi:hypothetical protein [Actinokineospora sp. HUAS TT18]|uniref:hypothetical protein n=1 Tax=Actinokineospora sp. HUAS TT18 TaxID=3447451 RepID=UPI003F51EEAB
MDDIERADDGVEPRMPRWVKVTVIAVGIVIAVLVILMATGVFGSHGPGRHLGLTGISVSA